MPDILMPVGLVVRPYPSDLTRVYPMAVEALVSTPAPPTGVTLTNVLTPEDPPGQWDGGYCIVGSVDPMIVRLVSGEPIAGQPLFLVNQDDASDGYATEAAKISILDSSGPLPLGHVMPVGPSTGSGLRLIDWKPVLPKELLRRAAASVDKISDTGLTSFLSAPVKAGRRYRIEVCVLFTAAGGGIKLDWAATLGMTYVDARMHGHVLQSAPATSLVLADANFDEGDTIEGVGPLAGNIVLEGVLETVLAGGFQVRVAQSVSDINPTSFYDGSWLKLTEL